MSWRASAYIKEMKVCPKGEPLTRSEKLVAYALADSHQDRGNSHTFPSVEVLAEDSLMTKRECQRILASLECKGVITRIRPTVQFRGVTTFYRFPLLDDTRVRVTPKPPLRKKKGDTQATLNLPVRVTEGCQKGDISRPVYKEEQEQEQRTEAMKPLLDDPSVSARILSEVCGNFNMRFQADRAQQLKAEAAKRGISTKAVADLMISQWRHYNSSRPKLNCPVQSAEKFWTSGIWEDAKSWPWRDPPKKQLQTVNGDCFGGNDVA
jgi:Helix-turn-helix domain